MVTKKIKYRPTLSVLSALALGLSFASCQKKKSSSSTEEEESGTSPLPTAAGGGTVASKASTSKALSVDSAVVSEVTSKLALSGSLSIIPAKSSGAALHLADTEYDNDESNLYVQDDAFEALEQASGIYCFVSKLGYIEMVNKGKYMAQVDESKCFGSKGGSSGSSDSQQGAVEYSSVIVDSVREEGKPLKVEFWIPKTDESTGADRGLYAKLIVAGGVTPKNPVGVFRLNWAQEGTGGGLEAFSDESGNIVVRMADAYDNGEEKSEISVSALLTRNTTTEEISGGLMSTKLSFNRGSEVKSSAYKVAFNDDRMLRQDEAGANKCFDRNEFYTLAWDYNLYEKSNGKRVDLNSGYPLEYKNAEGKLIRAHIGYYGLWAEGNQAIPAGATVSRIVDWKTHAKQDYTVVKSAGKLIKNTRIELTLPEITGIDLNYWNPSTSKQSRVTYNGTKFEITGAFQQDSGQGGSWTDVTPSDFTLPEGHTFFWSEGLGSVEISSSNSVVSKITITTNEDVTASAGDLALTCLVECPVASITSAMIASTSGATPFSPDRDWQNPPTTLNNKVDYTFSQSEMSLKRAGAAVEFASGASTSGSQRYQGGIRSGAMLPSASATTVDAFHSATVYYNWEMGSENWNKFTGIKDSSGVVAKFDPPIQFTYVHKEASDADGRGKPFYEKKFRLNYGGPGQLWGIPNEKTTQGWQAPLFSIKSGAEAGPEAKYLVKIMNGEQRMKEAASCTGLEVSGVPSLPSKADLKPIAGVAAPSDDDLNVEVIDGIVLGAE